MHDWLVAIQSLISSAYLQFVFFRNSKGLSSEPPRQTWYICTVVTIWICSIISPLVWSLFYSIWCRFRSRRSFGRTSIIRRALRKLICFSSNLHVYRTQFLMDLFKDPVLSSVIPMVTPTRCHRAIGGNLVWGDGRQFDYEFTHFNVIIRLSKG